MGDETMRLPGDTGNEAIDYLVGTNVFVCAAYHSAKLDGRNYVQFLESALIVMCKHAKELTRAEADRAMNATRLERPEGKKAWETRR